jgi:hypothetical protein
VLPNPLLGKESKNFVIYFAFRSAFTTFDFVESRMRLGKESKNFVIYFAFRSAFTTFARTNRPSTL